MNIEQELKLILNRKEYDRLCAALGEPESERVQENSYWDTPDRKVTSGGALLRLRIAGGRAKICVKSGLIRRDDGVFRVDEDEEEVDSEDARSVLDGITRLETLPWSVLERLTAVVGELPSLERWGEMRNLRRVYPRPSGLVLEIDCISFPGNVTEWELEAESADAEAARKEVQSLFRDLDIPVRPQTRSKSDRLSRYLSKQ